MMREYSKKPDKAVFKMRYAFGEPWCKMVKRELIEKNNIRFSETIIHNDTRYSYLVGFYSKNIHVDKRAIYCVTDRIGSVSKRVSLDRLLTRTAVFAEANQFFKKHHVNRFDERGLRPLLNFVLKVCSCQTMQSDYAREWNDYFFHSLALFAFPGLSIQ